MTPRDFPRSARLLTRADFDAVQQQGRRMSTRWFTVIARPAPGASDRLGIIASRKLGGAVVRNRAKRRLRDIFRRRPDAAREPASALDLVVIPRRELAAAPFADLEDEFFSTLRKLRRVRVS